MKTIFCVEARARYFYFPTILVIAFIAGFSSQKHCYSRITRFKDTLDTQERGLYEEIVKERRKATITSLLLGIFISFFYITMLCLYGVNRDFYHIISDVSCILLASIYIFYHILPKKKSMLTDANLSNDEVKKWFNVYKCMETSFWKMFAIGLVVAIWFMTAIDLFFPPPTLCVSTTTTTSSHQSSKKPAPKRHVKQMLFPPKKQSKRATSRR
jgi:hypothetical protein